MNNENKGEESKKIELNFPFIRQLECLKCGYQWFPKSEKYPKVCPNCNNRRWDRPKKK